MKKNNFIYSLLLVTFLSLSVTGKIWAWGSSGSDGANYQALQETAVFFNNSGETLSAGDVVILDTGLEGVVTTANLGSYVRKHNGSIAGNTQADSILVVGVVKSTSAADQTPVVVVTKGPVETTCADSSDAVTIHTSVGVSGLAGQGDQCGGGTNLGFALEAGAGTDADTIRIWVDPAGSGD